MACDFERLRNGLLLSMSFGMWLEAASARAEETPLAIAGVAYESIRPTVAPIALLRLPLQEARALTLSQIGWTSRVGYEADQDPRTRLETSVAFTPLRARLSHDNFDEHGKRVAASDFDDTALRVSLGAGYHVEALAFSMALVADKEWLSDYRGVKKEAFDTPFVGIEASLRIESLRSDEPLEPRIDGARVVVHAQTLFGAAHWDAGDVDLQLGRKWGPLFFTLSADAFHTALDTPISNFALGGAWDVLGSSALHGHPLGAFRLDTGAIGTARVDVKVIGPLELGVRNSVLFGASELHSGSAVLLHGVLDGVHLFVGVASPDHDALRGSFSTLSMYAGAQGALLFSP